MASPSADQSNDRVRASGLLTMLLSGLSNQTGAALGTHAFEAIGAIGVVAIRQIVAALVLVPLVRPPFGRFTLHQWRPVITLGLVFALMNITLYTAIDRIGLGLAVTLEFLGPLSVALAASRRLFDLLCAGSAAAGIYVLVAPGPTTDVLGVSLALLAGGCWASYILLNRELGRRLPGLEGTAAASAVSASGYIPVVVVMLAQGALDPKSLMFGTAAGALSSVIPFALDLVSLRTVPAGSFSVVMSMHPVFAALAGYGLLGEQLSLREIIGIAIVVLANTVAVSSLRPQTSLLTRGRAATAELT